MSYGDRVLFRDLTFGISKGDKVALLGRNGCGKSTLLRILAGKENPDDGGVSLRKGIRTEFLDQEPVFDPEMDVRTALFTGEDPVLKVVARYETLSKADNPDPDAWQQAMEDMDQHNAWDYEARVEEVLGRLGIHKLTQPVKELSGGQQRRLALARVLIQEPDFIILDEPTNHLDIDTVEWLEQFLSGSTLTVLLVTHDRYFLDNICNHLIELDQGQAYFYKGNYTYFLEKKAEREAQQDLDSDKARNLLRKELDWLRRQPKARTTKSKARIDAAHQLQEDARYASREKDIQLNFAARRLGSKILELHHISKAYPNLNLLDDFSYNFKKGERIGIVGPNGVGKTTFLNIVTGKQDPDQGEVITGDTIRFGYYTQKGLEFKPGQLILDVIKEKAENVQMGTGEVLSVAQVLTLFGFPPPRQNTHVSELSGGEKRRLHLLRVLMDQPNFLILDEPTNDLDLITLNTLEEFLTGFPGCLILVSHDRYFLDKLSDHTFVFEGKGIIKPFPGTYRQYKVSKEREESERKKAEQQKEKAPAEKKNNTWRDNTSKKKLSYKEQKEYEALTEEIEQLEAQKAQLTEQLNGGSQDHETLTKWATELETLSQTLEEKEERWLELAEIAEA